VKNTSLLAKQPINRSLKIGSDPVRELTFGDADFIQPDRMVVMTEQRRRRGMSVSHVADSPQPARNGESKSAAGQQADQQPTKVFHA
jgi:hypothetical protein